MFLLRNLQKFAKVVPTRRVILAKSHKIDQQQSISNATNIEDIPEQLPASKTLVIEPLVDREFIRVQGDEVVSFLQGMITNDMAHLHGNYTNTNMAAMYALFLNKAGRVLYETIIYRLKEELNTDETPAVPKFLIECDKTISNELRRHLRLYRVRRKIDIEQADQEFRAYTVFNPNDLTDHTFSTKFKLENVYYTPDPRLRELGMRVLTTEGKGWMDVAKIFNVPTVSCVQPRQEWNWKLHRYRHGVGEGVIEFPPGKCFPMESNADYLHGISFQKGCYIGQELTARTFHTGVIRKRLLPLRLTASTNPGADVMSVNGTKLGVIRDAVPGYALALLRVEPALMQFHLLIDGEKCFTERPKWWPIESVKTARLNR